MDGEYVGQEDVTQTLLHKHSYAETTLHTDAFTDSQALAHIFFNTHAFTHKRFCRQTLLHAAAFHADSFTLTLLSTCAFTHKRFSIHTLLHTETFNTQRSVDTLVHTNAILQQCYSTTPSSAGKPLAETFVDSISCLGTSPIGQGKQRTKPHTLLRTPLAELQNSQVFIHFYDFLIVCCNSVTQLPSKYHIMRAGPEIAILPQCLTIELHFVCKGCIS